jgi:hypothetical protein
MKPQHKHPFAAIGKQANKSKCIVKRKCIQPLFLNSQKQYMEPKLDTREGLNNHRFDCIIASSLVGTAVCSSHGASPIDFSTTCVYFQNPAKEA